MNLQYIDTEKVLSDLWCMVYVELRRVLGVENVYYHESLPQGVKGVVVDLYGTLVVYGENGEELLIEEFDDIVLYDIYRCVLGDL